ncbi:Hypothetical protein FKW44_012196, partial [Caligus rogercresseyi]
KGGRLLHIRGGNGLVLNAIKIQLMIGGNAKKKDVEGFQRQRRGVEVHPSNEIELLQVAINDAARSIVGCKRRDHIHIGDLLEIPGLPSFND